MNNQPQGRRLPAYCSRLNTERANELYARIVDHLMHRKLYRDPSYTTVRLAADLGTNTRYVSAAVSIATGGNYNALVNRLRLRDACKMLASPRFNHLSAEDIALLAGFSSRQSFYVAFRRTHECTPREYRLKHLADGAIAED